MNQATIRQWYDVFKANNELVEIRILDPETRRTYSGYFTNIEDILREVSRFNHCNCYFTLNVINPACYGREQKDKISMRPKSTTSDSDIIARKWCLIDVDCEKPSDTNSTDEEKEEAKQVVNNIYKFLRDEGFERPVVCDSANGWHLLYKQAMKNTPENTETMKKFLQVLDMYFSTPKVKVDVTTHNSSRISKLYGTISRKGSNTIERPQRESGFVRVPQEVKATSNEYFEKVASYFPEPEKKDRFNNYGATTFDLDEFLSKHNIEVDKVIEGRDFTKYILKTCPFNSSHSAPDSAVFKMRDGSFGFKCLHNSDSSYTFRDFRLHFEPDAYSKRTPYDTFSTRTPFGQRQPKEPFKPIAETEEKGKKWLQMSDIKRVDIADLMSMPTGFHELDKKIVGLFAGDLTVLSGLSASGKTSWLDCLALNVVHQGYKVAIWSGEMQDWRFQGWIDQIAAGKSYTRRKEGYENLYYVPRGVSEKISSWLDDKLYLYNNEYGNRFAQLFSDIKELVEEKGIQLVILDNLAALSIDDYDSDKYSNQTKFILDVKDYAKKKNIHIILVAHPRKQNYFLRREGISGSADLSNIADNVILIHRVGKDFETRAKEFFGEEQATQYMQFSTVVEISKNRQLGVTDFLTGLYYEPESRRLKNSIAEHVIYGWYEEPTQSTMLEPSGEFEVATTWDSMAGYRDEEEAPF